jgi:hypothetical protein
MNPRILESYGRIENRRVCGSGLRIRISCNSGTAPQNQSPLVQPFLDLFGLHVIASCVRARPVQPNEKSVRFQARKPA